MKKVCLSLLLLLTVSAFADPAVSNIRASQRENTKLVDVLYDVTFSAGGTISVTCEVSTNSGASYDIPAESFSGNGFGSIVTTGVDRVITWNAGVDWDENYSEQMKVRITAKAPRFTVNQKIGTDHQYDENGNIVETNYYTYATGTITDNETGLEWHQGPILISETHNTPYPPYYILNYTTNWNGANAACSSIGTGWRLPTRTELRSLLDTNRTPALPAGHPFAVRSELYWTSSAYLPPSGTVLYAWGVSVIDGFEAPLPQTSSMLAWPVRSIY